MPSTEQTVSNRTPALPQPDPVTGLTPLTDLEGAAKLLGVSVSTIKRLVKSGRLRCARIGSRMMFSASALSDFIQSAEAQQ